MMNLYRELISGNVFVDEATSGIFKHIAAASNPDVLKWEEVTSIEAWDKYGPLATTHHVVFTELKALYDASLWASFIDTEKAVFRKWMIATKAQRDEADTQETQEKNAQSFISAVLTESAGIDIQEAKALMASQSDCLSLIQNLCNADAHRLSTKSIMLADYDLLGYQKERTFDSLGDIGIVTYYEGYVDEANKGSKRVEETRTYNRNATTGLLEQRTILHKWYENDAEVASKTTIKKYSSEEGYEANKKAAKNLTRKASMYLVSQIGVANGQLYLDSVVTELSAYESGSRSMLLADIAGTDFTLYGATDATHSATIKGTLDALLNVNYA